MFSILPLIRIVVASNEAGNHLNLQQLIMDMNTNLASINAGLTNLEIRQKNAIRLQVAPHQCLPLQKRVRLILYATIRLFHSQLDRL